mmetsp:Transcript_55870/g.177086  ORF Transcript_55870/g.177086 Transcript_55870/m.177086 type:complete len:234 (-) Transcript_55870:75-776(-)
MHEPSPVNEECRHLPRQEPARVELHHLVVAAEHHRDAAGDRVEEVGEPLVPSCADLEIPDEMARRDSSDENRPRRDVRKRCRLALIARELGVAERHGDEREAHHIVHHGCDARRALVHVLLELRVGLLGVRRDRFDPLLEDVMHAAPSDPEHDHIKPDIERQNLSHSSNPEPQHQPEVPPALVCLQVSPRRDRQGQDHGQRRARESTREGAERDWCARAHAAMVCTEGAKLGE